MKSVFDDPSQDARSNTHGPQEDNRPEGKQMTVAGGGEPGQRAEAQVRGAVCHVLLMGRAVGGPQDLSTKPAEPARRRVAWAFAAKQLRLKN